MSESYLSKKPIPDHERLIFALDVPEADRARALVSELGDSVSFYKIGLELNMTGHYFELLDWLLELDKKVFVDLKFLDIPATVARAVKRLDTRGATFATVHAVAAVLEAATAAAANTGILAVTVLTSLGATDLDKQDVSNLVLSRARDAAATGCTGVVCSGLEAPLLRQQLGSNLTIVAPGIRPQTYTRSDDQKRTVDVPTAFANGVDYIVVGRPIRDADDPAAAAEQVQKQIADTFA